MEQESLVQEIARLESANDHMLTELQMLDQLLRMTGFSKGLESLKEVAKQMIENEELESEEEVDHE